MIGNVDNPQFRTAAVASQCADEIGTLVSEIVFKSLMNRFESNLPVVDTQAQMNNLMDMYSELKGRLDCHINVLGQHEEEINKARERIAQLEEIVKKLTYSQKSTMSSRADFWA